MNWKKKFITIYTGQAFSLLGSAAVQFAVIWWLTVQKESAITLTLATAASFLPNILLGPFAGVWIDRYNRRTVMIAADGLVAVSSAVLGIAFLMTGAPDVWFIYLILFIRGLGNTFHTPAMQAAIPMFVPVEMLTKAGGWGNLIVSVSTMLGPALGAGLMAVLPIAAIMLVDIIGAVFAIGCLLTVAIPDIPQSAGKVHILEDVKKGLAAMWSNKPLRAAFFPIIFSSILYMPLGSLFPLLVRVHYAGGILPAGGFWGFVVCCFFMGASGTFFNVPLMAYIQETVAPEMMGKVFSMLTTAMTLATPFGLLIAGPVSEAAGVECWFWASGLLMVLAGGLCMAMTRRYDGGAENR